MRNPTITGPRSPKDIMDVIMIGVLASMTFMVIAIVWIGATADGLDRLADQARCNSVHGHYAMGEKPRCVMPAARSGDEG